MGLFKESDMQYRYSAVHTKQDNPKLRGEPDSSLLSRTEKYEILYFVNKLAEKWKFTTIAGCQKIERLIHKAPSDLRSQEHVMNWIVANWEKYN
ncbi:hypothetical protein D3C78_1132440 [compost metagenome]